MNDRLLIVRAPRFRKEHCAEREAFVQRAHLADWWGGLSQREAGSEHLPKRLDGERLEAGTAGGGPQRGVVPPRCGGRSALPPPCGSGPPLGGRPPASDFPPFQT